ncbi:MAG: hypothetical protein ABIH52_01790 [Candidatus Aenigmatarchaeota archaeon]
MPKLDIGLPSYHGRGIISVLSTEGEPFDIYFAEGRSDTSRMRRLWSPPRRDNVVYMDVNSRTSVEEMEEKGGNPKLLLYDAMQGNNAGLLVVSNGFQTNCDAVWRGEGREAEDLIDTETRKGIYGRICFERMSVEDAIRAGLEQTGSEVDPLRTARIACVRQYDVSPNRTNLGIVVRYRKPKSEEFLDHDDVRVDNDISLCRGEGILLATYGSHRPFYHNAKPPDIIKFPNMIGAHTGRLRLDGTTPEQLLEEVWEGLPKDILVGVAVARYKGRIDGFRFKTKNTED